MAGLEGTVQVPAVGKVPKKEAAIGLAVVAALVVVYDVRKSKASSAASTAAAAATSTDQYPPDGTTGNPDDPYSTDPATGQTYGDESVGSGGTYGAYGDLGSAQTDTYPWDGTTGNEADPYSLDPASGTTYGDEGLASGGTNANPSGGPPFANNSDWETWAIQQLQTSDSSLDSGDLTTALGLYLNGQPVSATQKTLVFDATGIAGDPPVAGSNNYPPNVRTNGSTGGSGTMVTVPDVVGDSRVDADSALSSAGFKVVTRGTQEAKTGYTVTAQSPKAGTQDAQGSTVTLTVAKTSSVTVGGGTTTAKVRVPDVVGQKSETGGNTLKAAGFKVVNRTPTPKGKTGTITGMSPKAGTDAAKGSTVTVTAKIS